MTKDLPIDERTIMIQTHAERELAILSASMDDPNNRPLIEPFTDEIVALCAKFGNSGQSGGSAPYVANAIAEAVKKLCMHETIAPLTGDTDEWTDVSEISGYTLFQNNRDSRVFKEGNGQAYFIDAIVFDGHLGGRFTGNNCVKYRGRSIGSAQSIKAFPFTPKTFYVDVIDRRWTDETETVMSANGDWWTHELTDNGLEQMTDVFEYYDQRFSGKDEQDEHQISIN